MCVGQNLTYLSDTLECSGFDSCSNAITIQTKTKFRAYGAYSAYNTAHVIANTETRCYGASSCSRINYLETHTDTLCAAYKSCFNTTLTRTTSTIKNHNIELTGCKSGAYSTINLYQQTQIFAQGALSLYNATINIYNSSTVYAYQAFALSAANLFCVSGQTCVIECWNYGCANISSATGDGTYDVDCSQNLISNILRNSTTDDITYALSIGINNDLPSKLIEALISPNTNLNDDLNSQDDLYYFLKTYLIQMYLV